MKKFYSIRVAGGSQPAVLQEVSIPIWTNQDCRVKYGHAAPGGIVEHFLCAGQPSRDSCSVSTGHRLTMAHLKIISFFKKLFTHHVVKFNIHPNRAIAEDHLW